MMYVAYFKTLHVCGFPLFSHKLSFIVSMMVVIHSSFAIPLWAKEQIYGPDEPDMTCISDSNSAAEMS
jgi:hypothetical protein